MTRTYSKSDPDKLRAFAIEAARLLADRKCIDVVLLDVIGHSQVCDWVAVASGTSNRQMRSIAQELEELGASMGFPVYRSSRDEGTTWIVVDFVELVVHLFEPDQRLYYDLELLWADAARTDWKRPSSASKPAAGSDSEPARRPVARAPVRRRAADDA